MIVMIELILFLRTESLILILSHLDLSMQTAILVTHQNCDPVNSPVVHFWQNLRLQLSDSDSDESQCELEGDSSSLSVIMRHAGWLPDLAKWGGVASPAVRRHWCGCVTAALDSIRASSLELTVREKRIFKSLLERRDFWTDEQVKNPYISCQFNFPLVALSRASQSDLARPLFSLI